MRSTYHMSFTGGERLTVGGPDDVWVAVNKVGVEGSLSEGLPQWRAPSVEGSLSGGLPQ